jgi:hypothetical protein
MKDTLLDAIALSSPGGRMSKRARAAADKRLHDEFFPDGIPGPAAPPQPTKAWRLRRAAEQLYELAARGVKPRAYRKQAEAFLRQAEALEAREANSDNP